MGSRRVRWAVAVLATWFVALSVLLTRIDTSPSTIDTNRTSANNAARTETRPDGGNLAAGVSLPGDCDPARDLGCVTTVLIETVENDGIPAAFAQMEAIFAKYPNAPASCHSMTHAIGRASAKAYGLDAMKDATYRCQRGYLHGVMQELSKTYTTPTTLIEALAGKCLSLFTDAVLLKDCLHATGQSSVYTATDRLEESMDACLRIEGDNGVMCASGLLMEYGDGVLHAAGYTSDITAEVFADPYKGDLIELCESKDNSLLLIHCYMRLWMFEAPRYLDRLDAIDEMCASAPAGDLEHQCYVGVGNWIHRVYNRDIDPSWPPESRKAADDTARWVTQHCNRLENPLSCVHGAIASTAGHLFGFYPDDLIPQYCLFIRPELKAGCDQTWEKIKKKDLETLK